VTRGRSGGVFVWPKNSVSHSLQHVVENAVLPSEIEQLPDRAGYVKLASRPEWLYVNVPKSH
jgi:hypothetical protein